MSLLARTIAGDREAWERLVYLYSPLVVRWCCRWRLSEDQIQEVGQNVFLTLFTNLGKFRKADPEHSFRKWLKTITGHKVADHLRERHRDPVAMGGSGAREFFEAHPFEGEATASDAGEGKLERLILLRRCLDLVRSEFEPRTYAAFWGVVVDDKSPAEVAGSLGMASVGAVHTAKSRVVRRLRELMEELEDESSEL